MITNTNETSDLLLVLFTKHGQVYLQSMYKSCQKSLRLKHLFTIHLTAALHNQVPVLHSLVDLTPCCQSQGPLPADILPPMRRWLGCTHTHTHTCMRVRVHTHTHTRTHTILSSRRIFCCSIISNHFKLPERSRKVINNTRTPQHAVLQNETNS